MNRTLAIASAAIVAVLLAALLWPRADETAAPAPVPAPQPAPLPAVATPQAPAARAPVALSAQDQAFLTGVRDKFGRDIRNKHSQVKAIEQVIAYLKERYPDDWRERVKAFLTALFPELAQELLAKFEGLMKHNAWLEAHRVELGRMSAAERRAALWAARRDAFGADAEEIWAGALKSEQVRDALAELDAAQGMTVEEKVEKFVDAVGTAYGDQAPDLIENRQTELMNSFLGAKSVQDDLRAMPPAQRRDALRAVRAAMGMDSEALARWDDLDVQRDEAWDAGEQYMFQRDQILSRYEGPERDQRLAELQQSLFGAEAETIRSEEESGFFRYGRERRIGRE